MKDGKIKYCSGCHDDFYNPGCWSLKRAKVVFRKAVHINQQPPFKQKAHRTLSCYHKPQWVYIEADREY